MLTEYTAQATDTALAEATSQLQKAVKAKKCWSCGCLHSTLDAIEAALATHQHPQELATTVRAARERLVPVRYDCLGCPGCYPSRAANALQAAVGEKLAVEVACATDLPAARAGWPPLPGAYTVLRYQAPVALCTLTDDDLAVALVRIADSAISIVGTLHTENLGIERLIQNISANPHIRHLIVCGTDSRQAIGHLPGQSILALAQGGIDDRARIVGARGKRPVLRNVAAEMVEHFRRTVNVVDRMGETEPQVLRDLARACAAQNAEQAPAFAALDIVTPRRGYLPERMAPDPAGYMVLYVDRQRQLLSLEHYRNDGLLDTVLEGTSAAELYIPAIAQGLISRLDHAAYLGRELARAEGALHTGAPYLQDAAPETVAAASTSACACESAHATCTS